MKRIVISGSRQFNDYEYLLKKFNFITSEIPFDTIEIITGGARGTDKLGERFAREHDIKLTLFPAEWSKYGFAAGPVRNKQMAVYAKEEYAILCAFWNGKSKGTLNMIEAAISTGFDEIHVYKVDALDDDEEDQSSEE